MNTPVKKRLVSFGAAALLASSPLVVHAPAEAAGLTCRASMSDATPKMYSSVYVRVKTAPKARVRTVAHYKTTKTAKAKTAKVKTPKAAAPAKGAKTKKAKADGKMSAIDAAAKVLADAREPMNCKALIEAMAAKNLWTSPGGKTPHATLYSAILREINEKGSDARFVKIERGQFAAKK